MPTMQYHAKAQSEIKLPLLAQDNIFLQDIFTNEKNDPEHPVSAGLLRIEKGEPLVYTYTYDEMKIILEGEITISDKESGTSVDAKPGDVFYFEKGATITFSSPSYMLAFFTGARKSDGA